MQYTIIETPDDVEDEGAVGDELTECISHVLEAPTYSNL